MNRVVFPAVLVALVTLGLGGCVSAGPEGASLPLVPQSSARYQCGPTTLVSVLAYHGANVPESDITETIYSPTAHGALLTDLAWYARRLGFQTEVRTGTLADLQNAVAGRQPPIVLLNLGVGGLRQPHFTAIIGWSEQGVRYLSTKPAGDRVSLKTFQRQWQRAGSQYLLIKPAS